MYTRCTCAVMNLLLDSTKCEISTHKYMYSVLDTSTLAGRSIVSFGMLDITKFITMKGSNSVLVEMLL